MENERSVDRLARYLVTIGKISLICLACWLLRSMLIYIVLAAVMALIAKPVMKVLKRRLRLGKVRLPDWLCALLTIAVMVCLLFGFITMIIPIVIGIVQQISTNIQASAFSIPNSAFISAANLRNFIETATKNRNLLPLSSQKP